MGINSRVTKTETLNGAVDILLFRKFCLDHRSFEKSRIISYLREEAAFAFFGTSENRDEKLADIISRFELKFNKSGSQDFHAWFRKVFPRKGVGKSRLSSNEYRATKSLVGYVINRNLEGRNYAPFGSYKECSEDTKEEIKNLFISRMEDYQSKVEENLVEALTDEHEDILPENQEHIDKEKGSEEINVLRHILDNVFFDKGEDDLSEEKKEIPESLELMAFDLETRYMNKISAREIVENGPLTSHEIQHITKKVIDEFERENEGFDEKEIGDVEEMFYKRIRRNN